jgi:hypothetical protein
LPMAERREYRRYASFVYRKARMAVLVSEAAGQIL